MKINLRFVVFGVILACIAALGFSHGAWAGPLMNGTVPECPPSTTGNGETCYVSASATGTGSDFTITDVPLPADQFPIPPGSLNFGPAVDLEGNGDLVVLCFPDIDTPPVGNLWRWMSPADWLHEYNSVEPGRWVYWPTFHTTNGQTCTNTYDNGIYTISY